MIVTVISKTDLDRQAIMAKSLDWESMPDPYAADFAWMERKWGKVEPSNESFTIQGGPDAR